MAEKQGVVMPVREDAVEGKDFIYTQHPEYPDLQCKAWFDDDGNIISYRSLGDDGRQPGHLIKQPPALVANQMNKGSELVNIRWQKNRQAVSDAIDEWAQEIFNEIQRKDVFATLPVGKNGKASEAESTKLLIKRVLERFSDTEDKPPLRDMVMVVEKLLPMADRMGSDEKKMPVVAVQVNIAEGLFSKGFGS